MIRVQLKAHNGKFLCADSNLAEELEGSIAPIVANREVAQGWETFEVLIDEQSLQELADLIYSMGTPVEPPIHPPNPPSHPTIGDGTQSNPIIAMSANPTQIAKDVRASLAHYGRTDDAYWIAAVDHLSNGYSDGLYRIGWSRYWEVRADPTNTGSADVKLANEPSLYRSI